MPVRRAIAVSTLVALAVAATLAVAGLRGPRSPDGRPSGEAGIPSRVAMSSPVDPSARFFWELESRPRSLVPLGEIMSGGPPPDGIPAIDVPRFETVPQASGWLDAREPVVAFELNGDARAYPIQILTWHEIVNDVVGGEPVTVTFCPLCNSAVAFSRRLGDRVLDFGTSGRLYRSDLVMYDRQTKSLWPQIEGRAVVGPLIGSRLDVLPASTVSWKEWRSTHPEGRVLSRETGVDRPYGENPYAGYDGGTGRPFLFDGDLDPRLLPMERVVAVERDGQARAYPFSALAARAPAVLHDRVGGDEVAVFFELGTASALDSAEIARGRDVGASGVFRPFANGRRLTFAVSGGRFVDRETGSTWNLLGEAVAGPLAGQRLEPVPHIDTFWFAWAAFRPDTVVWRP